MWMIWIICKKVLFELKFLPSFFDVIVHLVVHLLYEAKLTRLVSSRWMYPIKRYLRTMKNVSKTKPSLEGCINEGYMVNEVVTFSFLYMWGNETKFTRFERNVDGSKRSIEESLQVFSSIRTIGASIYQMFLEEEIRRLHYYVLNYEELESYIECHIPKNSYVRKERVNFKLY